MSGQGPELPRRAALYMRLSRDDEGPGESASIASQRDLLRAYAAARGIPVAGEYADDGFSGTHFERPGFQRLLRDIESGKIDCVITKDLSRLGRNSARTAELLEEYFPRHAVRFISVGEGFDSRELSGGMAVAAPFMLLMNELYARDISQKIRAALRSRMERGDFISAFAPYGYRKDPADRHRLLVDEEAAEVVRRIFRLAAAGRRTGDIAGELNAGRIPTPAAYRRRQRREGDGDPGRWSSSMLCKLLRNPVYLGQTAQGKSTKLSFKSRETRANPREEWIVAEGTHEPLVSAELFELARRRAAARRCVPNRGFHNLFAGLARCADCGRSMSTAPTRKAGSAAVLCCGSYKAHGAKVCGNHFIAYEQLCRIVGEELRGQLALPEAERRALLARLERDESARRSAEEGRTSGLLRKQERQLRELDALIRQAFEQHARGELSDPAYASLRTGYERERAETETSLASLRTRDGTAAPGQDLPRLLEAVERAEPLTPELLKTFLERIEVGQGRWERDAEGKRVKRQTLRIFYRFAAPPDGRP